MVSIGTPAFVLYLATYEQVKQRLCAVPALERYQFVGHFAAGMAAETVSCLMYVPVDVIKERLQVQRRLRSGQEISGSLPMYRGTWHALATIMETEGLRGVYRVRACVWWFWARFGFVCVCVCIFISFLIVKTLISPPPRSDGGTITPRPPYPILPTQGYGATLLSFGPFSAFYFLFYEQFKHLSGATLGVPKADLPFHWTLARSVCSVPAPSNPS